MKAQPISQILKNAYSLLNNGKSWISFMPRGPFPRRSAFTKQWDNLHTL
jgi:hypothetical protein